MSLLRVTLLLVGALASIAAQAAAPELRLRADAPPAFAPEGWTLDTSVEGDFNKDGLVDSAFTLRSEDARLLVVALGEGKGLRRIGVAELDAWPLGGAGLEVSAKGVLVVTDLVGGTTAIQAVYRYRHDPASDRMRLIGLDLDHYSRTFEHGSSRRSWNYLTGASVAQDGEVVDGELRFGPERREKGSPLVMYMEDTPDPFELMSGEGGGE